MKNLSRGNSPFPFGGMGGVKIFPLFFKRERKKNVKFFFPQQGKNNKSPYQDFLKILLGGPTLTILQTHRKYQDGGKEGISLSKYN